MYIVLFFIEFALIFFLSRQLSKTLSHFLLRIFKNHRITIHILSFLFLPGVIVHELSHWLMAEITFVKTGQIEFTPQIHGDKVKLGSVAIAKTDPIRRFFIGVAPILFGLPIIFGLYVFLFPQGSLTFSWQLLLFFCLLFEIGNTMYSSSKDMEGAIGFFIFTAILIILYFTFHLHLPPAVIQAITAARVQNIFGKMDILLGILGGIDIVIIGGLRMLVK